MKRGALVAGAATSLVAGSVVLAAPSAFAAGTLPNGFTAAVVARPGQTISGVIDASGYDLGVYIGPGVHGVRVQNARITGANDEGILVQDARDVLIRDNTVEGNAVNRYPGLEELKAIALAGTRNVLVTGNRVVGNGDGGIGVYDDGPNEQTNVPHAIDDSPVAGVGNVVTGNVITDNRNGCGIVVSGKNPGGGVTGSVVSFNTVYSDPTPAGQAEPFTGGIVVAGGEFGAVDVVRTVVLHNTVTGGENPGIALHSGQGASISGTSLIDNVLTRNGASTGQHGIEIAGFPGATTGTQVAHDTVIDDAVGVFHIGDVGTTIVALRTSGVPAPVVAP